MTKEEKYVGLVTIYVAQGMLRAMVVRGALESAGIPVMLSYESSESRLGLKSPKGVGRVEVMVPHEWESEAFKLIHTQPPTGEVFAVPPDVKRTS